MAVNVVHVAVVVPAAVDVIVIRVAAAAVVSTYGTDITVRIEGEGGYSWERQQEYRVRGTPCLVPGVPLRWARMSCTGCVRARPSMHPTPSERRVTGYRSQNEHCKLLQIKPSQHADAPRSSEDTKYEKRKRHYVCKTTAAETPTDSSTDPHKNRRGEHLENGRQQLSYGIELTPQNRRSSASFSML